jgi:hypothetical protein
MRLACGACNTFDNRYQPPFQPGRPTTPKDFYDLRDRIFRDRKARILKCHKKERTFFNTDWQRSA